MQQNLIWARLFLRKMSLYSTFIFRKFIQIFEGITFGSTHQSSKSIPLNFTLEQSNYIPGLLGILEKNSRICLLKHIYRAYL